MATSVRSRWVSPCAAGRPAEGHVLVVDVEVLVEAAEVEERLTAHRHAAAADPVEVDLALHRGPGEDAGAREELVQAEQRAPRRGAAWAPSRRRRAGRDRPASTRVPPLAAHRASLATSSTSAARLSIVGRVSGLTNTRYSAVELRAPRLAARAKPTPAAGEITAARRAGLDEPLQSVGSVGVVDHDHGEIRPADPASSCSTLAGCGRPRRRARRPRALVERSAQSCYASVSQCHPPSPTRVHSFGVSWPPVQAPGFGFAPSAALTTPATRIPWTQAE